MLEKLIELLTALAVAVGGHGLVTAAGQADPNAADRAVEAVVAVLADVGESVAESTHGLALALTKVSNNRAIQALNDAAAAKAAGQAKAAAGQANSATGQANSAGRTPANHAGSAPVPAPPVDVPPTTGQPGSTPPFGAPPVPVPPRP